MGKKGLIHAIVGKDDKKPKKKRDHLEDPGRVDTFDKLVCELAMRNLMFKRMRLMRPTDIKNGFKRPVVLEPYRAIRFMRMIKATGACGARLDDICCLSCFGVISTAGARTVVTPDGMKILEETRNIDQMTLIAGCNKSMERDDFNV